MKLNVTFNDMIVLLKQASLKDKKDIMKILHHYIELECIDAAFRHEFKVREEE